MTIGTSSSSPLYLSALMQSGSMIGSSDAELLERFAARHEPDEITAELAFATLLARHGAMVMRVCRAALHDQHEADDAFQATFLVLALRAPSIKLSDSLAAWLHGVALRVSANARSRALRRQRHERRFAEMKIQTKRPQSDHRALADESEGILHEEIGRLPKRFRAAVVMCYLEGQTHEMAAEQSGCPVGTIKSRLATAREKLRRQLTRRGVAPANSLAGLPGSVGIAEPGAFLSSVLSSGIIEATLRGALQILPGQTTLTGIVSTEAVALAQGAMRTMTIAKLSLIAAAVMVSGLAVTGGGLAAAYVGFGRRDGLAGEQLGVTGPVGERSQERTASGPGARADDQQPAAPAANQGPSAEAMVKLAKERVESILREYTSKEEAFRDGFKKTKTVEERKLLGQSRPAPAFYAGALLQTAELFPGTPAAEDALAWIVVNLPLGSMAERAKEMLARDHAQSNKLGPIFNHRLVLMHGSTATERLFRSILAHNPDHRMQGLACYYLAQFLEYRASMARQTRLFDKEQLAGAGSPIMKESWGQDYNERLLAMDPTAIEKEAADFYERVTKEFGDIAESGPPDRPMLGRSAINLGEAARVCLDELKRLCVGQPAPEIQGVDLDGRPMKLSDHRGKVVVLYFCDVRVLSNGAPITLGVRDVAKRHASEPFALLGVVTSMPLPAQPAPTADREVFKKALSASGLTGRFWFDPGVDGKPGPIQAAWNTRMQVYVLDHRGVIRHKNVIRADLLEKSVNGLLKKLAAAQNEPKAKQGSIPR